MEAMALNTQSRLWVGGVPAWPLRHGERGRHTEPAPLWHWLRFCHGKQPPLQHTPLLQVETRPA